MGVTRKHRLPLLLVLLALLLAASLFSPATAVVLAIGDPPAAPQRAPVVAAGFQATDQGPSLPQNPTSPGGAPPGILNPTQIYNDLIVADLPSQSAEAGAGTDAQSTVTAKVTELANGITLSYPNVPKPTPCVDFNDKQKWASQIVADGVRQGTPWSDYYAGWASFALDDGGFYRSQPVVFSFDESVGNRISAKIASNQPYAARYGSPLISVEEGDPITVTVRYLLGNLPPGVPASDWVSLGIKPDALAEDVVYTNGFARGMWAELEQTTSAEGAQIMVLLQAHSPAAINSNVWFDDVEIFVNGKALPNCEYEESVAGN